MSCNCIPDINLKLAEKNTILSEAIVFGRRPGTSLMVTTDVLTKKRGARPVIVFPTYCPFCGLKYDEAAS